MTIQKFNHFAETKNRTIIQIKLNLPKFKFGPLTKFEPICQKKNMTYIRDVRGPTILIYKQTYIIFLKQ